MTGLKKYLEVVNLEPIAHLCLHAGATSEKDQLQGLRRSLE